MAEKNFEVEKAKRDNNRIIAGKYLIIKTIGQGGMGTIYKAWDIELERFVAIKMLLPFVFGDNEKSDILERFKNEAKIIAQLSHPNILEVFEVGHEDQNVFICMEYADSDTLLEYTEKIQGETICDDNGFEYLPPPTKEQVKIYVEVMKNVASGLACAHHHNIIHRDIKPENILMFTGAKEGDVIPKLSDFGLAKESNAIRKLTVTGQILGTPAYMSPEQARGDDLDLRADIFSFGALLYMVCTGQEPFFAPSSIKVLRRVIDDDPVKPSEINLNIPKDLENIILKSMEKDPNRRYHSIDELESDLDHFIKGDTVTATAPSLFYKFSRFIKRHASITIIIIAATLIIAFLLTDNFRKYSISQKKGRAYKIKADNYFIQKDYQKAKYYYRNILALNEDNEHAQRRLKECNELIEFNKKQHKLVKRNIQEIWLGVQPMLNEFYSLRGRTDNIWEQVNISIENILKELETSRISEGYFYLGMLYRIKGLTELAGNSFSKAIELDPEFSIAYILKALTKMDEYKDVLMHPFYRTLEDYKEIESEYLMEVQKLLGYLDEIRGKKKLPGGFEKYKVLVEALSLLKTQKDKCIRILMKGLETYNYEEYAYWLAVCNFSNNDKEFEKYINIALEIAPHYAEAMWLKGIKHQGMKDYTTALNYYDKAIKNNPYLGIAYINKGTLLAKFGNMNEAIKNYNIVIDIGVILPIAYFNRGIVYFNQNKYDLCLSDINKVIELMPQYKNAYYQKVKCLLSCGRFDEAESILLGLLQDNEKDSEGLTLYGILFFKKDDIKTAKLYFENAIKVNPHNYKSYLELAKLEIGIGNYKKAIKVLNTSISIRPEISESYYYLGMAYYNIDLSAEALKNYDLAIKYDVNNTKVYYSKAKVYMAINKCDFAILELKNFINGTNDINEKLMANGVIKYLSKDYEGGIDCFNEVIENNNHIIDAFYYRARCYSEIAKYDECIKDFTTVAKIDPYSVTSYVNAAKYLTMLGRVDEAEQIVLTGIKFNPNSYLLYNTMALICDLKKDTEKEIQYACRALELESNIAMNHIARAKAYYKAGRLREALQDYYNAVKLDNKNERVWMDIAAIEKIFKHPEASLKAALNAYKINPSNYIICYYIGAAYLAQGNYKESIKYYQKAIDINPQYGAAYLEMGQARAKNGDFNKSIAAFEQAKLYLPRQSSPFYYCGITYSYIGNDEQAINEFTKGLKLTPGLPRLLLERGNAYYRLKKYKEALTDYEKMIKISPEFAKFVNSNIQEIKNIFKQK